MLIQFYLRTKLNVSDIFSILRIEHEVNTEIKGFKMFKMCSLSEEC